MNKIYSNLDKIFAGVITTAIITMAGFYVDARARLSVIETQVSYILTMKEDIKEISDNMTQMKSDIAVLKAKINQQ